MSIFTTIALAIASLSVTGLTSLQSIITSANWVAGSMIVPGNVFLLPDSGTTTTNKVYVGIQETLNVTPSGVTFVTNGSQSGVSLKHGGVVADWKSTTACTNTGGLTKYPTCYVPNPFGSTGALTHVKLECGNVGKDLTMSGGFVTSRTTAISTGGFPTINDVTVGTGADVAFNPRATSGSYMNWKPDEAIKFQSITSMPTTFDCVLHAEGYDKYGR